MTRTPFVLLGLLCSTMATAALADTVDTIPFLAQMSPANENPPTNINATADALVWVHVVRDSAGKVTSGSVDFNVRYRFPGATTVTGLHIHSGAAGVNGPILIPTDVGGANAVPVDATGRGAIVKQVQFPAAPTLTVDVIQDLLNNPQNYYINIHTTENPGGAMRAQLNRADMRVLMGLMTPANENPPIVGSNAFGIPTVIALRGHDTSGAFTSGWVIFNNTFSGFPADLLLTGFHIHSGPAGVNGPVIINTGIGGGANAVSVGPTGNGTLHYDVPINSGDAAFAAETATLNGLFDNPNAYYINMHSTANAGGEIRSQLRTADRTDFQVAMSPANEVPPITGTNASAPAKISLYNLRGNDGAIVAGSAIFDVNYRGFAPGTIFTGLHIHDGPAGTNGPVTINTGLSADTSVTTDTGSGNVYRIVTVAAAPGIATLTAISQNPENAYVNMHTTVNPGGVVRSQLAAANTTRPSIGAATSNPDTKTTVLAPGEIFSIYGQNLAKSTSDLSGTYLLSGLPSALNGVQVTIGGKQAPLYFVSPGQINAQVPLDVSPGPQPVVVTTANGTSAAFSVTVAATAPAIYFDPASNTAAVLKNKDYSLVTAANPATAGDVLLVYLTGLGQTTPGLQTGSLQIGSVFGSTVPITATINGQNATVLYSIASPGFAGLYQAAISVPSGVSGNQTLLIKTGTATSNAVTIPIR